MKQGTIAGPFDPLYPEVMQKLRAEVKTPSARWVYLSLLCLFSVDENWETDNPVWVEGSIRATKIDIAKESGVGWKGFSRLWEQLVKAGFVIEATERRFIIPYYKKKAYDSISAREVRERFSRLEDFMNRNGQGDGGTEPDAFVEGQEKAGAEEQGDPAVKPGGWIQQRLQLLWPGRGFDGEADTKYIQELENYTRPELDAAFERARKDGASYGNYQYVLNYLRNPARYNEKPQTEGKKQSVEAESNPHVLGLDADWLKEGGSEE